MKVCVPNNARYSRNSYFTARVTGAFCFAFNELGFSTGVEKVSCDIWASSQEQMLSLPLFVSSRTSSPYLQVGHEKQLLINPVR